VTQTRLAETVGIGQGTLSNYENGVRDIPVRTLLALLEALGVGVGEFAVGVPDLLVLEDSESIGTVRGLVATGLGRG
jgi:transcriptional regulator with XRE-family HTH domain